MITKIQDLDVEARCAYIEEVANDLKWQQKQQILNKQFTEFTKMSYKGIKFFLNNQMLP